MEDDSVVGKLMNEMLDYGFSGTRETALAGECRRIVARLLRSDPVSPAKAESAPAAQQRSQALAELKAEFFRLAAERDRNRAGLTMEGLLNRLFATFELSPRLPFRVVGEQIDGSFVFDTHVYLMESKWEKDLCLKPICWFSGENRGQIDFHAGGLVHRA